jgi:phage baseplate assembly protein W
MMFQVLFTAPGERVNRPDFGCGIKRLVFAPNSEVSAALAQVTIFQALNKWLGSAIDVNDVKAQAIEERLEISITYTLKARSERRYLNLEVTRLTWLQSIASKISAGATTSSALTSSLSAKTKRCCSCSSIPMRR